VDPGEKRGVLAPSGLPPHVDVHLESGGSQLRQTRALHARIRVGDGDHHATNTCGNDGLSTRSCASCVRTRLERAIERGVARQRARGFKGDDFGMGQACAEMCALSDDNA
jgi:hypothetical protein